MHVHEHAHLIHVHVHVTMYIYIADMRTKEVSKCTATSERSGFSYNSDSMAFQPSADSFGISRLGFKCSGGIGGKQVTP